MGSLNNRIPQVLAVAGALLIPTASQAGAATVSVVTDDIYVVAAAGQANVVTVAPGGGSSVNVNDGAGVTAGTGCSVTSATSVSCNIGSLDRVVANLGDGDDSINMGLMGAGLNALGGDGNDTLTGSAYSDNLNGEGGDDVLDGGVFLGPSMLIADVLTGGAGVDTVSYASRTGNVRVDIDGGYDDGEVGEYDNIGVDVERVLGGSGNDTLLGSDGANELRGGSGNDVIDGRDGDDTLYGDAGDDRIDGRIGSDVINGGAGLDLITSRDSTVADTVACGADADSVVADREDTLTGCETVDVPEPDPVPTPSPTPNPTPSPTPAPTASPTPEPTPAPSGNSSDVPPPGLVSIVERTIVVERAAQNFSITLSCGAEQAGDCTGRISITADVPVAARPAKKKASASRRGRKMKAVGLGSVTFTVSKGKSKVISAKLSRRGVTQALRSTKTTKTAKGPVKRIKARMTISMRTADGTETTIRRPLAVEVPGAAR